LKASSAPAAAAAAPSSRYRLRPILATFNDVLTSSRDSV